MASGVKTCKYCGGTDIEVDEVQCNVTCTKCGMVLEENFLRSEVQFQESSGGGVSAIGQFISQDGKLKNKYKPGGK